MENSYIARFFNEEKKLHLSFFEGQKVIRDQVMEKNMSPAGFSFLRSFFLTMQHICLYAKGGESLGIYIDSPEPRFHLKLETNEAGKFRTLITPEAFQSFPESIDGICRLAKVSPHNKVPYNSIIDLKDMSINEVTDLVFKYSYQISSKIVLSDTSDQSFMLSKLPGSSLSGSALTKTEDLEEEDINWARSACQEIFQKGISDKEDLKSLLEKFSLDYIGSTEVEFSCNCSKDRMQKGVQTLIDSSASIDEIFESDQSISTKCEYCGARYELDKSLFS